MNNRYWSLEFNTEQTVDEIINKALAAEPLGRGSTSFGNSFEASTHATTNRHQQ